MGDKNQEFLDLAKQYEALSDQLSEIREKMEAVMADLGVGKFVQDPVTSLVYKIIQPEGTFIYFRKIDYKRTAKEGERGGTVLSKKEAQENGFVLLGK